MEIFNAKQKLPENGRYVCAYFPDKPWIDGDNKDHKWVVVKFVEGISESEREKMAERERKHTYRSEDQEGNNLVPYNWKPFGPGQFFGQECEKWFYLPQ